MAYTIWMYQLNPSRGFFADFGPTTYENTKKELATGEVGPWYFHAGHSRARVSDVLLIKIGGTKPKGIVALGLVSKIKRERGVHYISFVPQKKATAALMEDPISPEWLKANVRKQQSNLVDLSPANAAIKLELSRRGVHLENALLGGARMMKGGWRGEVPDHQIVGPIADAMDSEGRRLLKQHVMVERKRQNRERVLALHEAPYQCQACGMSFADRYGRRFGDYIEVHHKKPVSSGTRTPSVKDFALLCSNCHAVAHWKAFDKPRTLREIRALVR